MSGSVTREVQGFRYVVTQVGDTLQALCAREIGDATVWAEIAAFNGLKPPYIVDDPELVVPGVVVSGSQIRLPAPTSFVSAATDPEAVFLVDIQLSKGRMQFGANGDLTMLSGRDNLRQALVHRIVTPRGELVMHADYGSLLSRILGAANGPTARLLAGQYARAAVLADSRVSAVRQPKATVNGDVVTVELDAETIAGKIVNVEATP